MKNHSLIAHIVIPDIIQTTKLNMKSGGLGLDENKKNPDRPALIREIIKITTKLIRIAAPLSMPLIIRSFSHFYKSMIQMSRDLTRRINQWRSRRFDRAPKRILSSLCRYFSLSKLVGSDLIYRINNKITHCEVNSLYLLRLELFVQD